VAAGEIYAWTIPNAPSVCCLFQVIYASNAFYNDLSNAFFSILAE